MTHGRGRQHALVLSLDYSSAVLEERWQAGAAHMDAALKLAENPPSDAARPGLTTLHIAAPTDAEPRQ